jgi:hypothetical protein
MQHTGIKQTACHNEVEARVLQGIAGHVILGHSHLLSHTTDHSCVVVTPPTMDLSLGIFQDFTDIIVIRCIWFDIEGTRNHVTKRGTSLQLQPPLSCQGGALIQLYSSSGILYLVVFGATPEHEGLCHSSRQTTDHNSRVAQGAAWVHFRSVPAAVSLFAILLLIGSYCARRCTENHSAGGITAAYSHQLRCSEPSPSFLQLCCRFY